MRSRGPEPYTTHASDFSASSEMTVLAIPAMLWSSDLAGPADGATISTMTSHAADADRAGVAVILRETTVISSILSGGSRHALVRPPAPGQPSSGDSDRGRCAY